VSLPEGYLALHKKLYRVRGKAASHACSHLDASCRGPVWWANISHEYLDVDDFMPLCVSHHRRYDGADASHMHTPEIAAKISKSMAGRKQSIAVRAAQSYRMTGVKRGPNSNRQSDSSRAERSRRQTGVKRGPYKPRNTSVLGIA